jgi:hypothetical protein
MACCTGEEHSPACCGALEFVLLLSLGYAGVCVGLSFAFTAFTHMVIWVSVMTPMLFVGGFLLVKKFGGEPAGTGFFKFFIWMMIAAAFVGVGMQKYTLAWRKYGTAAAVDPMDLSNGQILNSPANSFAFSGAVKLLPETFFAETLSNIPVMNSCSHARYTVKVRVWVQALVPSGYQVGTGKSLNAWVVHHQDATSASNPSWVDDANVFPVPSFAVRASVSMFEICF